MKIVVACLLAVLALPAGRAFAAEDTPPHSLGECGGIMKGFDGKDYQCGADRRPACDLNNGRCVCLEQTDCGGARNEPF